MLFLSFMFFHINGLCIYLFHYDYAFMGVKYRTFLKRLPRTKYLHYDAEIWRGNGPYPWSNIVKKSLKTTDFFVRNQRCS